MWRSPPSCFAPSPAIPSQHHLLLCTPSPAPPPGSGYILEEVKAPIQGKRDRELRGDPLFVFLVLVSFLVLLVLVFLLLLLLLLTPPHPSARICVSSVVRSLTDWLLCLSVLFAPLRAFCVAPTVPLRPSQGSCRIPSLLVREIDCCVICDLQLDWTSSIINLPANRQGYVRQIQDHRWKTLGEENSDLPDICLCNPF